MDPEPVTAGLEAGDERHGVGETEASTRARSRGPGRRVLGLQHYASAASGRWPVEKASFQERFETSSARESAAGSSSEGSVKWVVAGMMHLRQECRFLGGITC